MFPIVIRSQLFASWCLRPLRPPSVPRPYTSLTFPSLCSALMLLCAFFLNPYPSNCIPSLITTWLLPSKSEADISVLVVITHQYHEPLIDFAYRQRECVQGFASLINRKLSFVSIRPGLLSGRKHSVALSVSTPLLITDSGAFLIRKTRFTCLFHNTKSRC